MANKVNKISIQVTNPETRDPETYQFDSVEQAIEWLTERKGKQERDVQARPAPKTAGE